MSLTIGSLFSGIGGLELGLEQAGLGPVLWQVESNSFCREVLARHWPHAERFEDVRTVGASNLVPVDVLCGGFPCQDISLAGKGRGLAGERSGLWYEFERIIDEVQPFAVVIENVPGLIRRGLDRVVAGLHELGYAVEGTRIRAEDLGAPHRRERLFLLAHALGEPLWDEPRGRRRARGQGTALAADDGEDRAMAGRRARDGRSNVAYADGARLEERRQQPAREERAAAQRGRAQIDPWPPEPSVGRVAHGVPRRVERLRALGNAVVPACAAIVGARLLQQEEERTNGEA